MNYRVAFGVVLKKLREEKNLSRAKLGQLSGIDRTHISRLEKGERGPTIESIYMLANALGISGSEMLKKMENPTFFKSF
ncbi:MAG: helix-turn-helix transcriptional regulator [Calditrichaeota bacterium]|nr:helix-turn-helix transcriptional regulator [Calditrichota bacterium]